MVVPIPWLKDLELRQKELTSEVDHCSLSDKNVFHPKMNLKENESATSQLMCTPKIKSVVDWCQVIIYHLRIIFLHKNSGARIKNNFANATMVISSYFLMLLLQSATVQANFPKEKYAGPKMLSVRFLKSVYV